MGWDQKRCPEWELLEAWRADGWDPAGDPDLFLFCVSIFLEVPEHGRNKVQVRGTSSDGSQVSARTLSKWVPFPGSWELYSLKGRVALLAGFLRRKWAMPAPLCSGIGSQWHPRAPEPLGKNQLLLWGKQATRDWGNQTTMNSRLFTQSSRFLCRRGGFILPLPVPCVRMESHESIHGPKIQLLGILFIQPFPPFLGKFNFSSL